MLRCLPLAGITPPATLSVVSGLRKESTPSSLDSLNWNSTAFFDEGDGIARPSSKILQIATLAAQSMAVVPFAPPIANSSFHMQFYGPTLQCSLANSSQQSYFNHYAEALANSTFMTVTKELYETGNLSWGKTGPPTHGSPLMNVYSAFSPFSGQQGWLEEDGVQSAESFADAPDAYENWAADLTDEEDFYYGVDIPEWTSNTSVYCSDDTGRDHRSAFKTQQLWVQASDENLVCVMGNASFDVDFEFVDSALAVAEYSVSSFEPFWMPQWGGNLYNSVPKDNATLPEGFWNPTKSYMAVYLALSSLLNGNVSTTLTTGVNKAYSDVDHPSFDGNVTIFDGSSKILQHGLSACDDFVHNYVSSAFYSAGD